MEVEGIFDLSVLISFVLLWASLETCSTQTILGSTSPHSYSTTPLSVTEGSVRLLYGSSRNEGRLEVYWKSDWYAVCSRRFNRFKADLVCRQLGYSASEQGPFRFGYGEGELLFSVTVDNLYCTGYESSFLGCHGVGLQEYECFRNQTVGVICSTLLQESTIPTNTIRLVDGPAPHTGRVEIYFNGFWTTICNNNWSYRESTVVCRQLGFPGADNTHFKFWEASLDPYPILGRLQCDGTEKQWTDCWAFNWNEFDCGPDFRVGVNCISGENNREGDVRLVGTSSENAGRVEIYQHGLWVTICDHGWNIDDAKVVCRQLGFPGALFAVDNAYFGQGNWEIYLDDVSCNGTEYYLSDCKHSSGFRHNCRPGDEAGVRCNMPDVHYPRLANGSKPFEGRVEIWNGDQWAKLCSTGGFYENEANTVCKELGFFGVDYFASDDRFGHGYGPPSEKAFECSEEQDSLSQCRVDYRYDHDNFCGTIVLGCNNSDSLSPIASVGIACGATVLVIICFVCICKQCKSQQSCKTALPGASATGQTENRAEPDGQHNEGITVISTNVYEDAPPAYNDVVDSHV